MNNHEPAVDVSGAANVGPSAVGSLTHADHALPGERLYMSCEWGTDPCSHCAESWVPTRWDVSRSWICKSCDEVKDRYQGGNRRNRT